MVDVLLSGRRTRLLAVALAALSLFGCGGETTTVTSISPSQDWEPTPVDYSRDVQPIFDQKCIACHACYDAPCQLKLSGADGVERGLNATPVYKGSRLEQVTPTRLGIDAQTPEQWREKGFHTVLPAVQDSEDASRAALARQRVEASLLYQSVSAGYLHRWAPSQKIPEDIPLGLGRQNSCPTNPEEYAEHIAARPNQGMPFAVTGLTPAEFNVLQNWIATGADTTHRPTGPTQAEARMLEAWERWLNRRGLREQLVARYLFEHWFAAHLYLQAGPHGAKHFFEILRSQTPPGEPIVPIATVRPNDDPNGQVYYRLRLIDQTIVAKTHIVYRFDQARLNEMQTLFFDSDWSVDNLPGYGPEHSANPFATFAAIPAKVRYRFMLNDAEYFVRNFIRGPVCRGQVATNVIQEQFWALFENPETERYVNVAPYRDAVTPLLALPGQDSDLTALASEWLAYRGKNNRYLEQRQREYSENQPDGPTLDTLWDGDGQDRDALLTIIRHHDNAFVEQGFIGGEPLTLWVMDYPLLERTYYHLVVNFNVFGNVSHQAQTRLYFDLIRHGGETNFLRFMPPAERSKLMAEWYAGSGKIKQALSYEDVDTATPTGLGYLSGDPKAEFIARVLDRFAAVAGPVDLINACQVGSCDESGFDPAFRRDANWLRPLVGKPASELPVAKLLPEFVLLRVGDGDDRRVYSVVHNRRHSNVAFMLNESLRLRPELDTLIISPELLGVYPNFIFDVDSDALPTFVEMMEAVDDAASLEDVVDRFGVRRTHPKFWEVFHDITAWHRGRRPLEAGILDMNRYANL